jgi:hypothetical protein
MITIEGIKLKAKTIPKKQLVSAWKTLTDKPLPKVQAFQLEDSDFDRVMRLRRCAEDMEREVEEWGRVLSTRGTDACVFNADVAADTDYIILVRENPFHSIRRILKHELAHIERGDL